MTRPTDPAALRAWAREKLVAANPYAKVEKIERYLDAYAEYQVAQANIAEHGSIVMHPRTGAPIPNPYLPIRDKAARAMDAAKLRTNDLWSPAAPSRAD